MITAVNKEGLVRTCLATLKDYLGADATLALPRGKGGAERLEIRMGRRPGVSLTAEVRPARRLTGEQARHIVIEADRLLHRVLQNLIVLAEFVDENAADVLRKGGVNYVDAQGNAYLRHDDPNLLIDVRKSRAAGIRKAEPGRLVEPGGLKAIHELLTRPGEELPPYRDLAVRAGVALGTVAVVIRELERLGHIVKTGPEKRRIARRTDLIELFVRGYALKLRPACVIGRFRNQNTNAEGLAGGLDLALFGVPHALTGGVAAGFYTNHLVADTVELFLQRNAVDGLIAKEKMLRDDQGGNVLLLDYFGPTLQDETATHRLGLNLATPLLVYAELLQDGRPREVETAEMILNTYLMPS
jgi:hypothetical protein